MPRKGHSTDEKNEETTNGEGYRFGCVIKPLSVYEGLKILCFVKNQSMTTLANQIFADYVKRQHKIIRRAQALREALEEDE